MAPCRPQAVAFDVVEIGLHASANENS